MCVVTAISCPPFPRAATSRRRGVARLERRSPASGCTSKGRGASIPNPAILIDTLSLQETKASSEIENITTTQAELFQASLFLEGPGSPAAKEVAGDRDALRCGFDSLRET
jgi:Fic family protein